MYFWCCGSLFNIYVDQYLCINFNTLKVFRLLQNITSLSISSSPLLSPSLLSQRSFQRRKPVQGCWDQPSVCCKDHSLPGRAEAAGPEGIPAPEEASSPSSGAAAHSLHHPTIPGAGGGAVSGEGAALQSVSEVRDGLRNVWQDIYSFRLYLGQISNKIEHLVHENVMCVSECTSSVLHLFLLTCYQMTLWVGRCMSPLLLHCKHQH